MQLLAIYDPIYENRTCVAKQMLTCTFKQSLLGHFFPVQNDQIVFESKCLFKIIIKCGFPKLGHIKWYYSCSIIERNVKAVVHLASLLSG